MPTTTPRNRSKAFAASIAAIVDLGRVDLESALPAAERPNPFPRVTFVDLKITNKQGELVPFLHNQEQRRYCAELGLDPLDPDIRKLKLREIILKGRQQGFSTFILALVFLDTINNPNTRSIIAAHNLGSTENIFDMVKRFHANLPKEKQHLLRGDSSKELNFADIDSTFEIGTAGTPDLGSGSTYHNIVKSERAKWVFADPRKLRDLDASLDAAGKEGNIWQESTAKGRNHYETDYNKAINGESNYTARFFPWFEHEEYSLPLPANETVYGNLPLDTRRELAAKQEVYGLTDAQMYWYRVEAIGEFGDLAAQEYPFNPEEAFISSADGYFDAESLRALNDRLKSPDYNPLTDINYHPAQYGLLRQAYQRGELEVWEEPMRDRQYILSADSAWCESEDSDMDSADVWDTRTLAQVAHLHGRWLPETYAALLNELGLHYNKALLAVESNPGGAGDLVIRELRDMNYPEQRSRATSGLYLHDDTLISETRRANPETLKAGWPTNKRTKPFAMGKLKSGIIEGLDIRSRRTVRELFTFVRKPGGSLEAEGTAKDDCVMSAAIGAALLDLKFDQEKVDRRRELQPTPPPNIYGGSRRDNRR